MPLEVAFVKEKKKSRYPLDFWRRHFWDLPL